MTRRRCGEFRLRLTIFRRWFTHCRADMMAVQMTLKLGYPMKVSTLAAAAVSVVLLAGSAARAEGDYSSPKAAAKSFVTAIAAGDSAGAKEAIVPNEKHGPIIEALAKLTGVQKKLGDAAVKAFGEAGKELSGNVEGKDPVKLLDSAEIKEDGDTATLTGKDDPEPLMLRKIDGKWKVDLAAMPNATDMESSLPMLTNMAELMAATTTEIEAGKYKSVEEAKQAISMKLLSKMTANQGPVTAPTSGPGQPEGEVKLPPATMPTTQPN